MQTGIIDPIKPKIIPSTTNGNLIAKLLAPTKRIIDISLFRENIVNLIVLTIKNIVIKIRAKTAKIDTFCTTLKTVTN